MKNKETLEEAAERQFPINKVLEDYIEYKASIAERKLAFMSGAKWQQERMYSEEEVLELLLNRPGPYLSDEEIKEWFEQFKKK